MSSAALMLSHQHPYNFKAVIGRLGLLSGLKLCLDAGDAVSYITGQSWLDRSGNGYDFFRGASGGSAGDDPTFNGTANQHSANEYFSYDGGDFFRYDSTNEAWMNNLHKDGAKFSIVAFALTPNGAPATQYLFSTAALATHHGISYLIQTNAHTLTVANGSGSVALNATNVNGVIDNTWLMAAVSVDEAATTGFFNRSGTVNTFTSTYSSPSASAASLTADIGAQNGGAQGFSTNGSRLGCMAIWEGVALAQADVAAIFTAMRTRYGI